MFTKWSAFPDLVFTPNKSLSSVVTMTGLPLSLMADKKGSYETKQLVTLQMNAKARLRKGKNFFITLHCSNGNKSYFYCIFEHCKLCIWNHQSYESDCYFWFEVRENTKVWRHKMFDETRDFWRVKMWELELMKPSPHKKN